jgi:hypothetical protein
MPLHLVKLCVGAESVEDLDRWIEQRVRQAGRAGNPHEHVHTTRMTPKRVEELLDGGSLYWVIKGGVQCRQKLADIRSVTDGQGIGRCDLVFEREVVRTVWQPRRPFQGWRYLVPDDAPADLGKGEGTIEMPAPLRRELAELGLL